MAEELEKAHPKEIVSKMAKVLRRGKVFIDWSQNDSHKTTVCVYSLRAKDRPTASTPITWEEVEEAHREKDREKLVFLGDEVARRAEEQGDLFEPVLKMKQRLKSGY
jgi:bifunctional non-homologous end joining protein LigD